METKAANASDISMVIQNANVPKIKKLEKLLPAIELARQEGVPHREILEWVRSNGIDFNWNTYHNALFKVRAKAKGAEQKASCVSGTSPAPVSGSAPTIKQPLIQAVGSGLQAQGSNSLMPDKRFTHDAKGTAPEW